MHLLHSFSSIAPIADSIHFVLFCLIFQDDETGLTTQFVGFDRTQPTCRQGGKPEVIKDLRSIHPYDTVVMVGDGITDLEAAQVEGGADFFVGYCGERL